MQYKNEAGWSVMGMVAGIAVMGALSFGAGMALADTMNSEENVSLVRQALKVLKGYQTSGSESLAKAAKNASDAGFIHLKDKKTCEENGGTWDVDACYIKLDNEKTCQKNGGKWTNGHCCINGARYALIQIGSNGRDSSVHTLDPNVCGCPKGITPQEVNGKLNCCKGEKAWDFTDKNYTMIDPVQCGCPKKGDLKPKKVNQPSGCPDGEGVCCQKDRKVVGCCECQDPEKEEFICCKDGRIMDDKGNYTLFDKMCGCPQNVTPNAKGDCCKGGKMADEKGNYTQIVPSSCGCPPDGHAPQEDSMGALFCCQNGKEVNPKTGRYTIVNPKCCPKETPYAPKSKICCPGLVCGEGVCAEGAECCPEHKQKGSICINGHWEPCGLGYEMCCPDEGSTVWYCEEGMRKCRNGKPYPDCCPAPLKFAPRSGTCCNGAVCNGICIEGAQCCNGEEKPGAVCINGKWRPCGKGRPQCCPKEKPEGPHECDDGEWRCTGAEVDGKCLGYGDEEGHFES